MHDMAQRPNCRCFGKMHRYTSHFGYESVIGLPEKERTYCYYAVDVDDHTQLELSIY